MRVVAKAERKVIKLFGRIYQPANWAIFLFGLGFMLSMIARGIWGDFSLEAFMSGLIIAIQGYGEVKDDEDIGG